MTRSNIGPNHEHDFYYYLDTNEEGWRCCSCAYRPGEPQGFSPELDRSHTYQKVMGILLDLHNGDFVHVSNGTHGECLQEMVTERCRREGIYDQYSITLFLLEALTASHQKYWKEVSDGVIAGKDPRRRCPCGALATSFTWKDGVPVDRCSPCFWVDLEADQKKPRRGQRGAAKGAPF